MLSSPLRRKAFADSPIRIGIAVSIAISTLVSVLGFWDLEDMLTYFYSTGASFGGVFHDSGSSRSLVYRLLGVPVLDFGIIGGYRLPYQGVINAGPFWVLSSLVSAQLIVFSTHMLAMMVSGAAFGQFWKVIQSSTTKPSRWSNLLFIVLLIGANYPSLEYVLDQDWYSNSLAYQGFFTIASALLSLIVLIRNNCSESPDTNFSLRLAMVGLYLLLMGLWSYLPLYGPPLFILACVAIFGAYRRRMIRAVLSGFFRSGFNRLLFIVAVMYLLFVVVDVSIELSNRSLIDASGVDYWWAQPSRSVSDLQHFAKQLFATEIYPWSAMLNSLFGERLGIPTDLTRIPHSAVLVMSLIAFRLLRGPRLRHQSLMVTLIIVWGVSFLQMIHLLPNPLRIRSDSFFRDILLSFAMFAVSLVFAAPRTATANRITSRRDMLLPAVVLMTSFAVSLSYPLQHLYKWQKPSPYGLVGVLGDDGRWSNKLRDALDAEFGVVAVVDPTFLNRWSEFLSQREALELAGANFRKLEPDDWNGLYGSFQLRQSGFIVLEGQPKIRDATAFTGLNNSLKQSLEAPTADFCNAELFGFLGVTHVIASPETLTLCRASLNSTSRIDVKNISTSEITELPDSGMSLMRITSKAIYESPSLPPTDAGTDRCGLLADPRCLSTLQVQPSSEWTIAPQPCKLPCLHRLSRQGVTTDDDGMLLLPLNAAIPLAVADSAGRHVTTSEINGLLAIPTVGINGNELVVTAATDWRMWLQVALAYGQYVAIGFALVSLVRNKTRTRKSGQVVKQQ